MKFLISDVIQGNEKYRCEFELVDIELPPIMFSVSNIE